MKAADLIRKAHRALESSHLLIAADDLDGACNRAYYAMFDAARAALHVADIPALSSGMPRSPNGVISAFSQYLVNLERYPSTSVERLIVLRMFALLPIIMDHPLTGNTRSRL